MKNLSSSWFESMPGSQTSKSRPDPTFSFSFLQLSRFEWRKISNGSNRAVCNAPFFQAAFSTTVWSNRRCSEAGCSRNKLARPARQPQHVDGLIDGGWCGLLDILDLAQQTTLLLVQGAARSSKNSWVIRPSSLSMYMVPTRASIWS
jgi:hypothetical protein